MSVTDTARDHLDPRDGPHCNEQTNAGPGAFAAAPPEGEAPGASRCSAARIRVSYTDSSHPIDTSFASCPPSAAKSVQLSSQSLAMNTASSPVSVGSWPLPKSMVPT